MPTSNANEARRTVQLAAALLADLGWIDQYSARQISPLSEAVANMFMVLFYQAETGQATLADFQEAIATVRRQLAS